MQDFEDNATSRPPPGFCRAVSVVAAALGGFLFAGLFVALLSQVVARWLFDRPAAWTEELASILFIATIFWGAAYTLPLSAHVSVDLVGGRFPPRLRRLARGFGLALVGGCFIWALPGIVDYVGFMDRETTPVLGLRLSWVYAVFPAFVAMIAARCAAAVVGACRAGRAGDR